MRRVVLVFLKPTARVRRNGSNAALFFFFFERAVAAHIRSML